jgi:hypothetical protein
MFVIVIVLVLVRNLPIIFEILAQLTILAQQRVVALFICICFVSVVTPQDGTANLHPGLPGVLRHSVKLYVVTGVT